MLLFIITEEKGKWVHMPQFLTHIVHSLCTLSGCPHEDDATYQVRSWPFWKVLSINPVQLSMSCRATWIAVNDSGVDNTQLNLELKHY